MSSSLKKKKIEGVKKQVLICARVLEDYKDLGKFSILKFVAFVVM